MENKVVGVVLDLSIRHTVDDRRIIDVIKEKLIAFVQTLNTDDSFYLYQENSIKPTSHRGRQVHAISNYQSAEFNLSFALKQTMYILAAEDDDCKKQLILITDRLDNAKIFRRINDINDREQFGIEVMAFCIGTASLPNDVTCLRVDDVNKIDLGI